MQTVRLVDPVGQSRLVTLSSWAYRCEWTCLRTQRVTTFVPLGAVTDGHRRPLWVADAPDGAFRGVGPMRPIPSLLTFSGILNSEDRAMWDELYARVPPLPSAVMQALLRTPDEDGHGY
jgi:hypothetical protein